MTTTRAASVISSVPRSSCPTGGQQADPTGKLRGHVDRLHTVGGQPCGQRGAEPRGTFDRPNRVGPAAEEAA